jgi:hypothetical protein
VREGRVVEVFWLMEERREGWREGRSVTGEVAEVRWDLWLWEVGAWGAGADMKATKSARWAGCGDLAGDKAASRLENDRRPSSAESSSDWRYGVVDELSETATSCVLRSPPTPLAACATSFQKP